MGVVRGVPVLPDQTTSGSTSRWTARSIRSSRSTWPGPTAGAEGARSAAGVRRRAARQRRLRRRAGGRSKAPLLAVQGQLPFVGLPGLDGALAGREATSRSRERRHGPERSAPISVIAKLLTSVGVGPGAGGRLRRRADADRARDRRAVGRDAPRRHLRGGARPSTSRSTTSWSATARALARRACRAPARRCSCRTLDAAVRLDPARADHDQRDRRPRRRAATSEHPALPPPPHVRDERVCARLLQRALLTDEEAGAACGSVALRDRRGGLPRERPPLGRAAAAAVERRAGSLGDTRCNPIQLQTCGETAPASPGPSRTTATQRDSSARRPSSRARSAIRGAGSVRVKRRTAAPPTAATASR